MLSHRLYFVAGLSTLFLSVSLLLIAGFEPAHAQCEPGVECVETLLPTATPVRTDCPPGSHPIGIRDCEVDGTGGLPGPVFSSTGVINLVSAISHDFDGSTLIINGSLPNISGDKFDRQTADSTTQTCSGASVNTDVNYQAYSIVNITDQVHTVDIEMTKDPGILEPVLYLYSSFDPDNPSFNCLKADEGDKTTSLIRRFTWRPGEQFFVIAAGFSQGADSGGFTLTITSVGSEQEPNDTPGEARPISPNIDWVTAEISGTGDIDYYRFEAVRDQRVWIYVRTDQSTASQDSLVQLRNASNVILASDDNNGGQGSDSSSIAGFRIVDSGTYLVRVTETLSSAVITPYYLYVYLSDQDPVLENEGNNNISNATTYDNDGGPTYQLPPQIFQGHQGSAVNGIDFFQVTVPLSSVIFASLDTDPIDDGVDLDFDGTLGLYDTAGTQVVSVDSGNTIPRSEALSYGQTTSEMLTTTTWYASVISDSIGTSLQYHLLAGYSPTDQGDVTYSTDVVNKIILDDGSPLTSTLTSGNFCMDNLDVWLDLDHDNLDDLDLSLQAPDGTTIELFTDRGGDGNNYDNAKGMSLSITLDDEGGLAPLPEDGVDIDNAKIGGRYQTEDSTLSGFYQKSGIGRWVLTIVDDTSDNNDPGTIDKLNNWALIMHCGIEQIYLPVLLKNV